jgi:hypothetical protein
MTNDTTANGGFVSEHAGRRTFESVLARVVLVWPEHEHSHDEDDQQVPR